MPNWELKSCCKHDQVVFLATIGVFTVVILALWRTIILTPFKLITVFLHEASHAIACILTCGKVEGIQVHANEGGVTQTRGGIYCLILPAGCNTLLSLIFIFRFNVSLFLPFVMRHYLLAFGIDFEKQFWKF
ncbi:uncharacterized protein LOC110748680 [Prunus avium]|uniref:Uncharacterized protein LOC110748680 n=1 Tax=Prunus avium TaxID=42229 RepID=A0A6P5RHJ8_PRUAV|nr:uncharacterized protein LOC110748680 [Prunus avium]